MKLYNFIPFGKPQSGTVIIQLMTELDVSNKKKTGTAIPKSFRKQSNAPILRSLNRMSQCTCFENI